MIIFDSGVVQRCSGCGKELKGAMLVKGQGRVYWDRVLGLRGVRVYCERCGKEMEGWRR